MNHPKKTFPRLTTTLSGCEGSRYLWQTLWMQGLQDQLGSLLGPPFLWESMRMEGVCGMLVASRAFSLAWLPMRCAHLSSVLFRILADPGLSSWHQLGKHSLKTKHVPRKGTSSLHLGLLCSTLLRPPPTRHEASPDWDRRRVNDGVNGSRQTLREMSSDSHQTGAGAPSTEC